MTKYNTSLSHITRLTETLRQIASDNLHNPDFLPDITGNINQYELQYTDSNDNLNQYIFPANCEDNSDSPTIIYFKNHSIEWVKRSTHVYVVVNHNELVVGQNVRLLDSEFNISKRHEVCSVDNKLVLKVWRGNNEYKEILESMIIIEEK